MKNWDDSIPSVMMENSEELTGFELETREVSTQELDEVITNLKAAREEHDKAKAISSEKNEEVVKLEQKLIDLLTMAGKTVYELEKVARVTIVSKTQVTTPKSIEDKEKFFGWVEGKLGKEGLLAYQTVNFQSLNSLYNAELAKAVEKGEDFNVPGLELPQVVRTLQVRSK